MSRKKKTEKYELDFRYGKRWEKISLAARDECQSCCFCLIKKSAITHHVAYVDNEGNLLLDNVILGEHIFPLCRPCHRIVHSGNNYLVNVEKQFNKNSQKIVKRLDLGYKIITGAGT